MEHYDKGIVSKSLVWIDRVFNWLTGGNYQHTISARTGKYSGESNGLKPFWEFLEAFVNLAFFPIDGPNHCDQAYQKEIAKDPRHDFKKGSAFMQALVLIVITLACIPVALVLWIWKGIENYA
jgi:hypothetical protein